MKKREKEAVTEKRTGEKEEYGQKKKFFGNFKLIA